MMWIIDYEWIARNEEEKEEIIEMCREKYGVQKWEFDCDYFNVDEVTFDTQVEEEDTMWIIDNTYIARNEEEKTKIINMYKEKDENVMEYIKIVEVHFEKP